MIPTGKESSRATQWMTFADEVTNHIETYTVPQYGDWPDDNLTTMSDEAIVENIKRYLARIDSNSRGPKEGLRDMLKCAHYICELYHRKVEKV